jgi:hypothetical protein
MRAALLLLLLAAPAAACPWHGSTGHSPWAEDRFGMAGPMLPFEEPTAAMVAPPPSREEALAVLREKPLAATPALKTQPESSTPNSQK